METWRVWDLVLERLELHHDVLAPTLPGHAGGPPVDGEVGIDVLVAAVERAMDTAGFETAHIVGNSLGGFLALALALRGRARSVVALAPAGGWEHDDDALKDLLGLQLNLYTQAKAAAPHAEALLSTVAGRRRATQYLTTNFEHIPTELLVHQLLGVASCDAAPAMIDHGLREGAAGWRLDAEWITCPTRIIWGTADRLLPWPSAAARFREQWLRHADWVELDGVGHYPQLDVPLETAQLILGFTSPYPEACGRRRPAGPRPRIGPRRTCRHLRHVSSQRRGRRDPPLRA